nr:hypothetical protein [Bradyrhizobium sp. CCBAU 11386]
MRRPRGQTRAGSQDAPSFGPSRRLDFEAELGAFLGEHSVQGVPVPLAQAWTTSSASACSMTGRA